MQTYIGLAHYVNVFTMKTLQLSKQERFANGIESGLACRQLAYGHTQAANSILTVGLGPHARIKRALSRAMGTRTDCT